MSLAAGCPAFSQLKSIKYDSIIRNYDHLYGDPFPNLQLEDTSGTLINISSLFGKTVYVDFWFTTCPPCIKEIPYFKSLQQYFLTDTNIVFLSICIENIDRKSAWKEMIKEKQLPGLHLFYARNRPQKINLLRKYNILFPTYLLLDKELKVVGYNAPRPSETGWVHWAIIQSNEGKKLSESFIDVLHRSKSYENFLHHLEANPGE